MMLLAVWATILLWSTPTTAAASSLCDAGNGWSVTWHDEFDAGALNRSIWTIPLGVGSSLGREANVTEEDTYVQDGMLVLRSRALPGGKSWTTGAAITNQRNYKTAPTGYVGISWQYGRFCVRAKLPGSGPGKSAGLWPAHWMMPADYSKHCGYCELDIMEMVDGDGEAHGTHMYHSSNLFRPCYFARMHETHAQRFLVLYRDIV
jgi:beta-glucanase (GH16 family)